MKLKMSPDVVKFFLSKNNFEDFFQKITEITTKNSKKWKEKKSLHNTCSAHGLS
jgi:hypothetical protein